MKKESQMENMFPETVIGFYPHEAGKVNEKFLRLFGVPFMKYYDGFMTATTGKLWVDVVKFDDYLHERFGQYEDDGKSMCEIITKKFGAEAEKFFLQLL